MNRAVGEPLLLDARGRPLMASPAYRGGGTGQRWTGFDAPGHGPTSGLTESLDLMRRRARWLFKNNPHLRHALRAKVVNIVGTGIVPRCAVRDDGFRRDAQLLFREWAVDADATGESLASLLHTAVLEMFAGGDALVQFEFLGSDEAALVPLRLHVKAGEHLPTTMNRAIEGGRVIRSGIEFLGPRPVAYHLHRRHPLDPILALGASVFDTVRVERDLVAHLFQREWAGQIRGEPGAVSVYLAAHDKDQLDDAAIQVQKLASFFGAFLTMPDGMSVDDVFGEGTQAGLGEFRSGGIYPLPGGVDFKTPTPPNPGAVFGDIDRVLNRKLALGVDVPYEVATGDLSEVNYSSIRAGLIEFRKFCESAVSLVIVPKLLQRVWREFIAQAVLAGALRPPRTFEAADFRALSCVRWIMPGMPWVDPEKQARASLMLVQAGFTSRERICAELGYDVEEIDEENAAAQRRAAVLGLTYSAHSGDGAAMPAPTEEPSDARPAPRRAQRGAR